MTIRGPRGNIQHSSAGVEDYTPSYIVNPARLVLEHIDLDPASCELANSVVKADAFWGLGDPNPLAPECEWGDSGSRVFLNPPGGKCTPAGVPLPRDHEGKQKGPGESYAAHWWAKLIEQYLIGYVDSAIFICFSLNIFQNSQELGLKKTRRQIRAPFSYPFCVPRQRPRYWSPTRAEGKGAPSQPGAVVFLPPRLTNGEPKPLTLTRFFDAFSPLGEVRL